MSRFIGTSVVTLGLAFMGAGWAAADEPLDVRNEIRDLQARLTVLEAQEREMRANRIIPPTGGGPTSLIPGVEISGFADVSYTYSFQEPVGTANTQRGFDTQANDFMINNVQLNLAKPATEASRIGFATSLMYGTDAEVVGGVSTGLGGTGNELEIYEAYVELLADVGNGLQIKAGKFGTLAGAELVPSMDNWNFTRSFIWLLAEPLTHTGVRFTYPWSEYIETTIGVNNGWDVVDDNNKGKTLEFGTGLTPSDNTSLYLTYIFGPETATDNADHRHLFTLAAGWDATDRLSLKLAYDIGWEEDAAADPEDNAQWDGVAVYGRYTMNDWWAMASRWEWFRDRDGVRTGLNTTAGGATTDINLWEFTLTNEFKVYKDMIARVEYRHDKANAEIFARDAATVDTQDTLSLEMIYPF